MGFDFLSTTSINSGINFGTPFEIKNGVSIPLLNKTPEIEIEDTFTPARSIIPPNLQSTETLPLQTNTSTTNTSIFTNTNVNTSTNQNIINIINSGDPNITFSVNTDPALEFGNNTFNVDNEWLNNATIIKIDPEFTKSDIISRLIDVNGWQKDLNPSQETINTYDLQDEMDLAMDNSFTDYYSRDFSSPSNSSSQEPTSTSSGYTPEEILLLSKIDQDLINGGVLASVASFEEAVKDLAQNEGIPIELAKLILTGGDIKNQMKDTPNLAPKLARLSNTDNNA